MIRIICCELFLVGYHVRIEPKEETAFSVDTCEIKTALETEVRDGEELRKLATTG